MTNRSETTGGPRMGVVGPGRLGTALAAALRDAGAEVEGPLGRGLVPHHADAIVLCVPDAEIPGAAAAVAGAARFVGHTSGATPLSALASASAEAFTFHPLQSFAYGAAAHESFAGAGCAIAGETPAALATARALAERLRMTAFEIDDAGRAAYHAAASIASNFLVTLEHAAESVAGASGLAPAEARALLAPLVRRTVENWSVLGPERALTGPIARGDHETVAAQRAAVADAAPELLALFDALAERTRALASAGVPA
jgi:predicted short-subunit dehydrogenase-like oxidoreductase (DUF2520 family)